MKIHRFISPYTIEGQSIFISEREIVFQMNTILKLKTLEKVILSDGLGSTILCEIKEINKKEVILTSLETKKYEKHTLCHAYVAILKKDNFEFAVQKMTELGVTDITPIITERTIKNGLNTERLEKIIKEATELSGQAFLPILHTEMNLGEAIKEAKMHTNTVLCFDEPDTDTTKPQKLDTASFFIGPEGGWTESEKQIFTKENSTCVSLGNTTLRGETAAIVGTFWVKERQ